MKFTEQTYVDIDHELSLMETYLTKLTALLEGTPDGVAGLEYPVVRKPMQEMVIGSRDNIQLLRRAFMNANNHKHRIEGALQTLKHARSFNASRLNIKHPTSL